MLGLNEIGNGSFTASDLMSELDEHAETLFLQIAALESGFLLLRFLCTDHSTIHTSDGIAFRLNCSCESVERALTVFLQLGLVRVSQIGDITLYGFTQDPQRQQIAQGLLGWQDRWARCLQWIASVISGKPGRYCPPDSITFKSAATAARLD